MLKVNTSGKDSGACAAWADLSEVLLDLDLTEDLLELFEIVEASLPFAAWDSVLPSSEAFTKKNISMGNYST